MKLKIQSKPIQFHQTLFKIAFLFALGLSLESFAPLVHSKEVITPNTGSLTPGFLPGQQSQPGLGQGPSNPGPYQQPNSTPPLAFRDKSCSPGILGTVPRDLSTDSDSFSRSYQCYSNITPGDLGQNPPTHHQQSGVVARPRNYANLNGMQNGIPGISEQPGAENEEQLGTQMGDGFTGVSPRGVQSLPNQ